MPSFFITVISVWSAVILSVIPGETFLRWCVVNSISDLSEGVIFKLRNGKVFEKGIKLRKRFKCVEIKTNKLSLFHPLAEVESVQ